MKNDNFSTILFNGLRILGLIAIIIGIFFLINITSNRLIEDKNVKSKIVTGKYILNLLAEEYEKLLKQRELKLEKEREELLALQNEDLSEDERRLLREKLTTIDSEKNKLKQDFDNYKKEKEKIEASVQGLEQSLSQRGEEISRLNKKISELTIAKDKLEENKNKEIDNILLEKENTITSLKSENEKEIEKITNKIESIEQYWEEYKVEIKNAIKSNYKFNNSKLSTIENEFERNNGKILIVNELNEIYSIIAKRDLTSENLKKANEKLFKDKNNEIQQIQSKMDRQEKENERLKKAIDRMEASSETYVEFYKSYSKIIKDFEKMIDSYRRAESLYTGKSFEDAMKEYKNVLESFEEINDSYEKLVELNKNEQNKIAELMFKDAISKKNKNDYSKAFVILTDLIKKAPESDYTERSIAELLTIATRQSMEDNIDLANINTKKILKDGDKLMKQKKYQEALDEYQSAITNYPYSDYIHEALEKNNNAFNMLLNENSEIYAEELKKKFEEKFVQFKNYSDKKPEIARKFYFDALNEAFNIYALNSIDEFEKYEDKYIESLIAVRELDMKKRYNIVD